MVKKITQEEFYAGLGLFFVTKTKREELERLQGELEKVLRGSYSTDYDEISDFVGEFIYNDEMVTFELFLELLGCLQIETCDVFQTDKEKNE